MCHLYCQNADTLLFSRVTRSMATPSFQTDVQKYIINFKHNNIVPFLFQNITHKQKRSFLPIKNRDWVTSFPYFMITFASNVARLCNDLDTSLKQM